MTLPGGSIPQRGRKVKVLLRVAVGAVLIALVVRKVEWHDQARTGDGETWTVVSMGEDFVLAARGHETARLDRADVIDVQPGLGSVIGNARWSLGAAALACALAIPFVAAERWRAILEAMGRRAPRRVVRRVTLQHYLVNLVALGTAGGDMYRAAALRVEGGGWSRALASLLMDRAAGIGSMALVAIVGSALLLRDAELGGMARVTLIVCTITMVAGAIVVWMMRSTAGSDRAEPSSQHPSDGEGGGRRHNAVRAAVDKARGSVLKLTDALRSVSADHWGMVKIAAWSLAGQVLLVAAVWLESRALGIGHAFAAAVVAVPAAAIVALFTPTPQGMGAFEWGLVALLGRFETGGVNACLALAVGFRLIMLWWALPAVVLWLVPGRGGRKEVGHEPVTAVQR